MKEYYTDVTAKMLVESKDNFDFSSLSNELVVLNKNNNTEFEIYDCLIEDVRETDSVVFFNLKKRLGKQEKQLNNYTRLTRDQADELKNNLKNLMKQSQQNHSLSNHQKNLLTESISLLEKI